MKKVKKTKPTIKGLQREVARLNQGIEEFSKVVREHEDREYTLRKQITEILMNGNGYHISYRPSSTETKSWQDIKTSIARLTGMVTKEGELSNRINHMVDAENARLWYLMRVAMRDPLLQVPVRPDVRLDIFGNEPPRNNHN